MTPVTSRQYQVIHHDVGWPASSWVTELRLLLWAKATGFPVPSSDPGSFPPLRHGWQLWQGARSISAVWSLRGSRGGFRTELWPCPVGSHWRLKLAEPWGRIGWRMSEVSLHISIEANLPRGSRTLRTRSVSPWFCASRCVDPELPWSYQVNCCSDEKLTRKLKLCLCSMRKCPSFSVEVEWLCNDQHFCFGNWWLVAHQFPSAPGSYAAGLPHAGPVYADPRQVDVAQVPGKPRQFSRPNWWWYGPNLEGILMKWSQV